MPRRARQLSDSGIYHVMLRGINRQAILLDEEDNLRFLRYLRTTRELSGCHVLAYCLMTNHVHLVLRTGAEPIGQTVKRLGVRYASWHNGKYDRVGHLFQDRFRSCPVGDDEYFVTLLRYVWNNPVRAGMVDRPDQYRWSSLSCGAVVDQEALLSLVEPTTLAQLAVVPEPEAIDPGPLLPPRVPLRDDAARAILDQFCRTYSVVGAEQLPVAARRKAIAEALSQGASVRQLSRLTSLSRMTVHRAGRSGLRSR